MTVEILIAELKKKNPKANVLTYIEGEEEYGNTVKIKSVKKQSNMPYSKGDCPKINGETILITGYSA